MIIMTIISSSSSKDDEESDVESSDESSETESSDDSIDDADDSSSNSASLPKRRQRQRERRRKISSSGLPNRRRDRRLVDKVTGKKATGKKAAQQMAAAKTVEEETSRKRAAAEKEEEKLDARVWTYVQFFFFSWISMTKYLTTLMRLNSYITTLYIGIRIRRCSSRTRREAIALSFKILAMLFLQRRIRSFSCVRQAAPIRWAAEPFVDRVSWRSQPPTTITGPRPNTGGAFVFHISV